MQNSIGLHKTKSLKSTNSFANKCFVRLDISLMRKMTYLSLYCQCGRKDWQTHSRVKLNGPVRCLGLRRKRAAAFQEPQGLELEDLGVNENDWWGGRSDSSSRPMNRYWKMTIHYCLVIRTPDNRVYRLKPVLMDFVVSIQKSPPLKKNLVSWDSDPWEKIQVI